jgi:RNA recognition motif 2
MTISPSFSWEEVPHCTHKLVPRRTELAPMMMDGLSPVMTTLMIKNIPNRYSQSTLLAEIDSLGFFDKYDFCHMPIDMVNSCNVGYAFINFIDPLDCQKFAQIMKDYKFRTFRSRKLGTCVPAHIQGLDNNLQHFSKTRVMGWERFKPFVKDDGDELSRLAELLTRCLEMCDF